MSMKRDILYFGLAFSALGFTKSYGQNTAKYDSLSMKQKDRIYLSPPSNNHFADNVQRLKRNFSGYWNRTSDNNTFLLAGLGFSSQDISTGDYNSSSIHNLSDFNTNVYKPGFHVGFRVDGKYKEKHNYSFGVVLNNLTTVNNYKDSRSLAPFIGSFSNFKAEDCFLNLSIAVHYKKLLLINYAENHKFYVVVGPSIDTRLSKQSLENLVNNNYSRFLVRADAGVEFENKNFYTLFFHYKYGITSFTKSPVISNINSLEIGMMIIASDYF